MSESDLNGFLGLKNYRYGSYTLAILMYILILLGGYTKAIGGGLACPDWPLCYGSLFPDIHYWFYTTPYSLNTFNWGLFAEYTHRFVALINIILIVYLFISGWTHRRAFPEIKTLTILFLIIVLIQSVFGGLTVLYKLHPLIVTGHLGLGILSFIIVLYNAQVAYKKIR